MTYTIGIDTSCYTTSLAIMSEELELLVDERCILNVKIGSRGLSQSEMVFQHTRKLPDLFDNAIAKIDKLCNIKAVVVSAFPRPVADSYMPAFLVGEGYGRLLAKTLQCPLQRISHQENHINAGIWSAHGPASVDFLVMHISGGTTEIVRVNKENKHISVQLLGYTQDLNAGQFIDRVGVALQLPFPAGKHLELLARQNQFEQVHIPVAVHGMNVSFSGPETYTQRLLTAGAEAAAIASGVQVCVAESLWRMLHNAIEYTGLSEVLLVGGVTSNRFIRSYLSEKVKAENNIRLFYPDPQYSPDNAVGCAYYPWL